MTLGIDIYRRYQNVTDWAAVAGSGVGFCWMKVTDGTSIASGGPPDGDVAGARAAGIAPGVYHYAEPGDPIAQADLFAGEALRLGCTGPGALPPALDLEQGGTVTTDFGRAFTQRLQERIGQARVALYASTSSLAALRPEGWGVDGLVVWAAEYGNDDGTQHPLSGRYGGPVAVHQYTDAGHIAGIGAAGVDLDWAFVPLETLIGEDELSAQAEAQIAAIYQQICTSWQPGQLAAKEPTTDPMTAVDLLNRAVFELTHRFPSRAAPGSKYTDTMAGYVVNSDGYGYRLEQKLAGMAAAIDTLSQAVAGQRPNLSPDDLRAAVREAMDAVPATVGATGNGTSGNGSAAH